MMCAYDCDPAHGFVHPQCTTHTQTVVRVNYQILFGCREICPKCGEGCLEDHTGKRPQQHVCTLHGSYR